MTKSYRWTRIDSTNVDDHHYITLDDECFFLGDWNKGDGHREKTPNSINQLISNLKIPRADENRRYFRNQAIAKCAAMFTASADTAVQPFTWVPIPSSKLEGHPEFNPRILDILEAVNKPYKLDIRQLVTQTINTRASHQSEGKRLSLEELIDVYELNEAACMPVPSMIVLLDDVLTAGTHYRAMHTVLSQRFPGVRIRGMFFARTVRPSPFTAIED